MLSRYIFGKFVLPCGMKLTGVLQRSKRWKFLVSPWSLHVHDNPWRRHFNFSSCPENCQRNLNYTLDFQMPSSETFWFGQIVVLNRKFDFVQVSFHLWYLRSHQRNLELWLPIILEKEIVETTRFIVLMLHKRWHMGIQESVEYLPDSSLVALWLNVVYMLQLLQSSGTSHFWHSLSQV